MKKYHLPILAIAVILLAAGFFAPLGSYTPAKSVCPVAQPPVVRLQLITGDTIQKVKDAGVEAAPNAGCVRQVKYELYVL